MTWLVMHKREGFDRSPRTFEFTCLGEAQQKAEEILLKCLTIPEVTIAEAKFLYRRKPEIEKIIL